MLSKIYLNEKKYIKSLEYINKCAKYFVKKMSLKNIYDSKPFLSLEKSINGFSIFSQKIQILNMLALKENYYDELIIEQNNQYLRYYFEML